MYSPTHKSPEARVAELQEEIIRLQDKVNAANLCIIMGVVDPATITTLEALPLQEQVKGAACSF